MLLSLFAANFPKYRKTAGNQHIGRRFYAEYKIYYAQLDIFQFTIITIIMQLKYIKIFILFPADACAGADDEREEERRKALTFRGFVLL
jgi:hypothetical protein